MIEKPSVQITKMPSSLSELDEVTGEVEVEVEGVEAEAVFIYSYTKKYVFF